MMRSHDSPSANGFTLVEMMVAIVVLAIGILGMAATTGYLSTRVKVAATQTDRAAAVQHAAEILRARDFNAIADLPQANAEQVGAFRVWWKVDQPAAHLKSIEVSTRGPAYQANGSRSDVVQTVTIQISRGL